MRNQPFTHQEIKDLPLGFTSSGYYPNRKARKTKFKNLLPISHIQHEKDKQGNYKRIIHYKTIN